MRNALWIWTAFVLVLAASPADAEGDPLEKHLFPPDVVMRFQTRIHLERDQRKMITEAIQELQAKMVDLQWEMEETTQALAQLLAGPAIDETTALEHAEAVMSLERQIKLNHLKLLIRIKNTLEPEQQIKLRTIIREQKKEERP